MSVGFLFFYQEVEGDTCAVSTSLTVQLSRMYLSLRLAVNRNVYLESVRKQGLLELDVSISCHEFTLPKTVKKVANLAKVSSIGYLMPFSGSPMNCDF